MPLSYSEPEVFFTYDGYIIYHVYPDDIMENGTREHWFSLTSHGGDGEGKEQGVFDERELPIPPISYEPKNRDNDSELVARRIRYAIDSGYFEEWPHDYHAPVPLTKEVPLELLHSILSYLRMCVAGANLEAPDWECEPGVSEFRDLRKLLQ